MHTTTTLLLSTDVALNDGETTHEYSTGQNLIAKGVIKTIMDGKQPRGLKLQDFMDNTISDLWEEQKVMFGLDFATLD